MKKSFQSAYVYVLQREKCNKINKSNFDYTKSENYWDVQSVRWFKLFSYKYIM